jgi:hypothetical protein
MKWAMAIFAATAFLAASGEASARLIIDNEVGIDRNPRNNPMQGKLLP